jgi:hypothetical protein
MDKTAYCRDKCASSANMISCLRDCMGRPVQAGPARAHSPKLLEDVDKKKMVIGSVVAIAAIAAVVLYMKKRR